MLTGFCLLFNFIIQMTSNNSIGNIDNEICSSIKI